MKDAMRSRQLRRTWLVIALLRHQHCTLRKLANEAGVTTRTIRHDLAALETAGLPLRRIAGEHGNAWCFVQGSRCPICNRGLATGKEYREAVA